MRELNAIEISEVSGAGFFSNLVDTAEGAIMGGVAGLIGGAIFGGTEGGNGGGILGAGTIGQGVGMVAGGLIGMVGGAIGGAVLGQQQTMTYVNMLATALQNGTFVNTSA